MSPTNTVLYMDGSDSDKKWGLTVTTTGQQVIASNAPYPSNNHPFLYQFNTSKGRVLDEYQLIYIIDGNGVFESSHQKRCNIHSGDMIMLFPGEWHTYRPDSSTGWHEHWVGFNGDIVDGLVKKGFFSVESPIFNVGQNSYIEGLFYRAVDIANLQQSGYQQILAGIVCQLLGLAYSLHQQTHFEKDAIDSIIVKAKEIFNDDFSKDINIQDVAREVGMNYSTFRSFFKQYTGFSPLQYIEQLRIRKSKELLVNTRLTSQQIAYSVGFNTPYYFSIFFKKKTGYTPLEYRNAFS